MKILICGDIVGKSGRQVVQEQVPILIKNKKIDFVIVNGENAANGFGITKKICNDLYSSGVDVITSGNHIWDQKEIIEHIECDKRLLRPCNYPIGTPGLGYGAYELKNGSTVIVINVMCRLFMDMIDDPFKSVDEILSFIDKKFSNAIIILDIHGESTSEKMALAHFFDGRVTAVVGTHTHIPTNDARILKKGTAYQTDAGMCGDYDSIIGMNKENSLNKFMKKDSIKHFPAKGDATLSGVIVDCNMETGLANKIDSYIFGGQLSKNN